MWLGISEGRGCSSHVLSRNLSTLTSCAKRLLTFVSLFLFE
jgi:hypothetical protein